MNIEEDRPIGRSGHSCSICGKYMVIFGGLQDITKELNDMHVFDMENMKWMRIYDDVATVVNLT